MKWTFSIFILILIPCLLISCGSFSKKKNIQGVTMNLSEIELENQEIFKVEEQYNYGKYVRLTVVDRNTKQKKEVVFNTMTGRIDQNFSNQLPENRYQINMDQDGNLKVADQIDHRPVLTRNLMKEDSFQDVQDLSFTWSKTGKYLFIDQMRSDSKLLLNIETNKKVDISLTDWVSIQWSDDDKMALISKKAMSNNSFLKFNHFIWNVESNEMQDMGNGDALYYIWSPDNQYLYSIDAASGVNEKTNKPYHYKVSRYSTTSNNWSVVHTTDVKIHMDSFKFLNNEQFIYAGTGVSQTIDPMNQLMKPQQDYVVKVDYSKNVETVRKLDSFLPTVFFWSFDNKYLYYQDHHGFFKAKVDF